MVVEISSDFQIRKNWTISLFLNIVRNLDRNLNYHYIRIHVDG